MDRYRIAPARPVCLSAAAAGPGAHLRPAGRRSGGAEIGIFTAERYFSAADVVRHNAAVVIPTAPAPALPDHDRRHELLPRLSVSAAAAAADVASQSGRTAASSEASWNSRSGLLSGAAHPNSAAARQYKAAGAGGAVYGRWWFGPAVDAVRPRLPLRRQEGGHRRRRVRAAEPGGGGALQRQVQSAVRRRGVPRERHLQAEAPPVSSESCRTRSSGSRQISSEGHRNAGEPRVPARRRQQCCLRGGARPERWRPAVRRFQGGDRPPRRDLRGVHVPGDRWRGEGCGRRRPGRAAARVAGGVPTHRRGLGDARGPTAVRDFRGPRRDAAASSAAAGRGGDERRELGPVRPGELRGVLIVPDHVPRTGQPPELRRRRRPPLRLRRRGASAERVHVPGERGERGVERGHGRGRRVRRGQPGQLLQRGVRVLRRRPPLHGPGVPRGRLHRRHVPQCRPEEKWRRRVPEQLPVGEGGQRRAHAGAGGPAAGAPCRRGRQEEGR